MASQNILERFRDLSSLTSTEVSDELAKDQYIQVALEQYNEIMDDTFLATSLAYQAKFRTKMYKDTGMLEWQRFYQGGLETLYSIDPTKVMYIVSRDIYIVRDPGVTSRPFMYSIYRDNVGSSSTTGGGT